MHVGLDDLDHHVVIWQEKGFIKLSIHLLLNLVVLLYLDPGRCTCLSNVLAYVAFFLMQWPHQGISAFFEAGFH